MLLDRCGDGPGVGAILASSDDEEVVYVEAYGAESIHVLACGTDLAGMTDTLTDAVRASLGDSPLELRRLDVTEAAAGDDPAWPQDRCAERELVERLVTPFAVAEVWRIGSDIQFMLDNIVMSDTRDEHVYHEMLVRPAMLAVDSTPQLTVLIVGGGEGATLREVLSDPRVASVVMVEIDEELVDLARRRLAKMHQGSFDDPRVTVVFEDGAAFARRWPRESFDVVLVDGVDYARGWGAPGHGNILFGSRFYRDLHRLLRPGGVLEQYMSDADCCIDLEEAGFAQLQHLGVDVPSFLGAGARFTLASRDPSDEKLSDRLVRRAAFGTFSMPSKYMSTSRLVQSFNHTARRLKGGGGSSGGGGDTASTMLKVLLFAVLPLCGGGLLIYFLCKCTAAGKDPPETPETTRGLIREDRANEADGEDTDEESEEEDGRCAC